MFINATPYVPRLSGQQATYREAYIELLFTFYHLFRLVCDKLQDILKTFGVIKTLKLVYCEVTDYSASDIDKLDDLITIEAPISKIISDVAYFNNKRVQKLYDKGITPVIPPRQNLLFISFLKQRGIIKSSNIFRK